MGQTLKQRHIARHEALKQERATWLDVWRELARYIRPYSGRFLEERSNDGSRKDSAVINSKPTQSARVLAAGMMAGITSPSRPWFRLTTYDPRDAEQEAVKRWLSSAEERVREVLVRANLYRNLFLIYANLPLYGTAALFLEGDAENLLWGYNLPTGTFTLATDSKGVVDTMYRDARMTVGQMVTKFGFEKCSPRVRELHREGKLDLWQDLIHCVHPNEGYKAGKLGPTGKRFTSVWLESGTPGDEEGVLAVSGYDEQPLLAPRWEVTGEDVYGYGPGHVALGDCRALQTLERRKAQLVDKTANPPMKAPLSMQHQRISLLPGDVTFTPDGTAAAYEPAYVVNPMAIANVREEVMRHEARIDSAFYADLWLMLAQQTGTMTAREVVERREEKLMQLGPVLEQLTSDLLAPLIDRVFGECLRRGLLPEPPQELQGQELRVEYISIMAQAQKMLGTAGVERLTSFVGALAQMKPDVLDKVDFDQTVDEYAAMLGTPPVVVRPDDQVATIRAQRAQQQQQAQALEAAQAAGQTAKTLSETKLEDGNALNAMLRGMGAR